MRILLCVDYNEFLLFYMLAMQAYKINEFSNISVGHLPQIYPLDSSKMKTLKGPQNRNLSSS